MSDSNLMQKIKGLNLTERLASIITETKVKAAAAPAVKEEPPSPEAEERADKFQTGMACIADPISYACMSGIAKLFSEKPPTLSSKEKAKAKPPSAPKAGIKVNPIGKIIDDLVECSEKKGKGCGLNDLNLHLTAKLGVNGLSVLTPKPVPPAKK